MTTVIVKKQRKVPPRQPANPTTSQQSNVKVTTNSIIERLYGNSL